jgi:diadenosine tetraphosphatase ApaH/serine/threonine PP2A family protein phosphatase
MDKEWDESARGAGILFGAKLVNKFLKLNKLEKVVRSHQLVQEGYK